LADGKISDAQVVTTKGDHWMTEVPTIEPTRLVDPASRRQAILHEMKSLEGEPRDVDAALKVERQQTEADEERHRLERDDANAARILAAAESEFQAFAEAEDLLGAFVSKLNEGIMAHEQMNHAVGERIGDFRKKPHGLAYSDLELRIVRQISSGLRNIRGGKMRLGPLDLTYGGYYPPDMGWRQIEEKAIGPGIHEAIAHGGRRR
jgi:hypothetical protein